MGLTRSQTATAQRRRSALQMGQNQREIRGTHRTAFARKGTQDAFRVAIGKRVGNASYRSQLYQTHTGAQGAAAGHQRGPRHLLAAANGKQAAKVPLCTATVTQRHQSADVHHVERVI